MSDDRIAELEDKVWQLTELIERHEEALAHLFRMTIESTRISMDSDVIMASRRAQRFDKAMEVQEHLDLAIERYHTSTDRAIDAIWGAEDDKG